MESLLKKKSITAIEIGPRQILFGLEMDDSRLTDLVLSCITRQCMADGQARLYTVIEELSIENSLQAFDILQLIFGFAILNRIRQWHTDLQTWYSRSIADGYPGKKRIRKLLALTAHLLENQTAYALLTNCHERAVPLAATGQRTD